MMRTRALHTPSTVTGGPGKLPIHTCDRELSDHVAVMATNQSGHMTQMAASSFQHLETLKGPGGGDGNGSMTKIPFKMLMLVLKVVSNLLKMSAFHEIIPNNPAMKILGQISLL